MEYRQLGGSGLQVPVLSFGTATFAGGTGERAWGNTQVAEATRLVDIAVEAGANLFDTADVYSGGRSEEVLGEAIKGRRDRVLLATKATFRSEAGPNGLGSSRHHADLPLLAPAELQGAQPVPHAVKRTCGSCLSRICSAA